MVDNIGTDNTKNLQCYISKKTILKRAESERSLSIRDGKLITSQNSDRAEIKIKGSLMGVVRRAEEGETVIVNTANKRGVNNRTTRNEYTPIRLDAAFEEYTGDPVINFAQLHATGNAKFHIHSTEFDNSKNMIIDYAGEKYRVLYSGKEPPHLVIKAKEKSKKSKSSRRVKGLKLE
jgi:hypothetical protein